ncbi:MAG: nitrate ABC transporter substrate-binding protein, partial [Deltaproteobacteria bacterium]
GYVGEAPATTAVANGMVRVKVLAQVNTEGSAIVVDKDSSTSTILDLRGKTVAVPGYSTVQDFLLQKAVAKWGLKQKDVGITVLKPPEMIGALRTGQIDAFIAWEPYPAKAQTMGVGKVLLYSRDIWKDHPCCALVVSEAFLEKRRKDAIAVIKAHTQATDFINQNPEEAIAIGVKYTGMDERTVRLALKSVNYTYHLSVEGEREYVKFLTSLKYIKVNDPDVFVKNFIDQSVLKEALAK